MTKQYDFLDSLYSSHIFFLSDKQLFSSTPCCHLIYRDAHNIMHDRLCMTGSQGDV